MKNLLTEIIENVKLEIDKKMVGGDKCGKQSYSDLF